jgi:lipid-binding SYLF domain-containing protein
MSPYIRFLVAATCALGIAGCASQSPTASGDAEQKRAALRQMKAATLADFYASNPQIEQDVRSAVGYGVFDASQVNVLLYVGSTGAGVLVDNSDQTETFMTMVRAGTGPGVGYKNFRQLLIFKNRGVFDTFRTVGADVGASADASFKMGKRTGASLDGSVSFDPALSVHQITENGILLQANWGGVAYLPDGTLNAGK